MNTFENTEYKPTPIINKIAGLGVVALVGLAIGLGSKEVVEHTINTSYTPTVHHIDNTNHVYQANK